MDKKVIALTEKLPVPVRFVLEKRRAARISLRKKQIILRIPKGMSLENKNKVTVELLEWAHKTIGSKNLYQAAPQDVFDEGKTVSILGEEYTINHRAVPGDKGSVHISTNRKKIIFSSPIYLNNEDKNEWIEGLLIKGLNHYFIHDVKKRVYELNEEHFQAEIGKVQLRYTTTRWGSCSSRGNISLSTKLLLVPPIVMDYVIIHELAHRFEMNHSKDFWDLVEKAMPDYKVHLQWLKDKGGQLII